MPNGNRPGKADSTPNFQIALSRPEKACSFRAEEHTAAAVPFQGIAAVSYFAGWARPADQTFSE
jgi:hypothetical protein